MARARSATRRPSRRALPRLARPRDVGATLTEIVITIALLGTLVVGTLSAVTTSIRSSSGAYVSAEVETVLLNAADRVARAPQLCEYEVYADAAALAQDWSTDSISTSVELLSANGGDPDTDWGPQPCPADVGPFDTQRVVITATATSGITRSMTVVKSSVD